MKNYQYQLIRYSHDHFTGEFINVGVVVYSKEERFLASKTANRFQRITNMFPEANGKWIKRILEDFNQQINRVSSELDELFAPSNSLEQITNSILLKDNSAIRLTETKVAIDVNLQVALNDLYKSQVERYALNKADKNTLLDEDVWRTKYKTHFEKYGIDKRLKTHDVRVPKDIISFEKSWKNDIWHCYEPLSFVLKEKDSIKDKVYKWAGKLKGLQQANEPLHLTLMTSIAPEHTDLKSFIMEYLEVHSSKLTVDIITDDKAESLAKEIYRRMNLHDNQ